MSAASPRVAASSAEQGAFEQIEYPDDLGLLRSPSLNAMVVERQLSDEEVQSFAQWARGPAFLQRFVVTTEELDPKKLVASLPEPTAWPSGAPIGPLKPAREKLVADIATISRWVSELTSSSRLEISIFVTDSDECSKWHADQYHLRGLVTYAGRGTEYLPSDVVDRAALERRDPEATTNEDVCTDPERIVRVETGHILWLKGKRASANGAVHRSPRLNGTGERRMLLRINEARQWPV